MLQVSVHYYLLLTTYYYLLLTMFPFGLAGRALFM
jgi:hypothetical protein